MGGLFAIASVVAKLAHNRCINCGAGIPSFEAFRIYDLDDI